MRSHWKIVPAVLVAAALVASCGDDDDDDRGVEGVRALTTSTCAAVEYGGVGDPDVLIASDLPMRGAASERSRQQVEAIRIVLEDADWAAGEHKVAFQACDDTLAQTGAWDERICKENALAYAGNRDLVGVVGTYNSGCAGEIIPLLNDADPGPVAMVSPGNTLVCLTQSADGCPRDEPDAYYPSGKRNYARVVPNDAFQGAGLAKAAKDEGVTETFVLYTKDDQTSIGQATAFRNAARPAGVKVGGFEAWDPEAKDYKSLMETVRKSGANGLLLAGLTEHNGARLIKDKVDVLGANDGAVKVLAFDGFAQQSTIDEAGSAAAGMFASVPGRDPARLSSAGKTLVDELKGKTEGKPVELYAPYAGEAAQVLLDAIEAGDGDRARTAAALFGVEIRDGILGTFSIEDSGDPSVGPVTVFKAGKKFEPTTEITPAASLVSAARGR